MAIENSVNTNVGALIALQSLSQTSQQLGIVQNRVSTGLKVAGARDNSAVFAIAQNLRADVGGLSAIAQSLGRADSALATALNAGEAVSDLLVQAREIAVAAADVSLDTNSRTALNNDFQAIVKQIDSVIGQATFNGTNLLKDSPDTISSVIGIESNGTVNTLNVNGRDLTSDSVSANLIDGIAFGAQNVQSLADLPVGDAVLQTLIEFGDTGDASTDAAFVTDAFDLSLVPAGAFTVGSAGVVASDDTLDLIIEFDEGAVTKTVTFTATGDFSGVGDAFDNATSDFNQLTLADFKVSDDGAATTSTDINVLASDLLAAGGTDVQNTNLGEVDLTKDASRNIAIQVVDSFLQNVNSTLATFGSSARQIELQSSFVAKLKDTVETGIGNLVDADLARESASLQALQVKQQLGIQALAIANSAPQSVLALFR